MNIGYQFQHSLGTLVYLLISLFLNCLLWVLAWVEGLGGAHFKRCFRAPLWVVQLGFQAGFVIEDSHRFQEVGK